MATSQQELIATRGAQMFPRLSDDELERLGRFGEVQSYAKNAVITRIGEVGPGLLLILSGAVEYLDDAFPGRLICSSCAKNSGPKFR